MGKQPLHIRRTAGGHLEKIRLIRQTIILAEMFLNVKQQPAKLAWLSARFRASRHEWQGLKPVSLVNRAASPNLGATSRVYPAYPFHPVPFRAGPAKLAWRMAPGNFLSSFLGPIKRLNVTECCPVMSRSRSQTLPEIKTKKIEFSENASGDATPVRFPGAGTFQLINSALSASFPGNDPDLSKVNRFVCLRLCEFWPQLRHQSQNSPGNTTKPRTICIPGPVKNSQIRRKLLRGCVASSLRSSCRKR